MTTTGQWGSLHPTFITSYLKSENEGSRVANLFQCEHFELKTFFSSLAEVLKKSEEDIPNVSHRQSLDPNKHFVVFERGLDLNLFGRGSNESPTMHEGCNSTPILPRSVQILTTTNSFILAALLSALNCWACVHHSNTMIGKWLKDGGIDDAFQLKILRAFLSMTQKLDLFRPDKTLDHLKALDNIHTIIHFAFHMFGAAGIGNSEILNILAIICANAGIPMVLIPSFLGREQAYFCPGDFKTNGITSLYRHIQTDFIPYKPVFDAIQRYTTSPTVYLYDPIEIITNPTESHLFIEDLRNNNHFYVLPQSLPNPFEYSPSASIVQWKSFEQLPTPIIITIPLPTHDFMNKIFTKRISLLPSSVQSTYATQLTKASYYCIPTMRAYSTFLDLQPSLIMEMFHRCVLTYNDDLSIKHSRHVFPSDHHPESYISVLTVCFRVYIAVNTVNHYDLGKRNVRLKTSDGVNHAVLRYDPYISDDMFFYPFRMKDEFYRICSQSKATILPKMDYSSSKEKIFTHEFKYYPIRQVFTFIETDGTTHVSSNCQNPLFISNMDEIPIIIQSLWGDNGRDLQLKKFPIERESMFVFRMPAGYPVFDAFFIYYGPDTDNEINSWHVYGHQFSISSISDHNCNKQDLNYQNELTALFQTHPSGERIFFGSIFHRFMKPSTSPSLKDFNPTYLIYEVPFSYWDQVLFHFIPPSQFQQEYLSYHQ